MTSNELLTLGILVLSMILLLAGALRADLVAMIVLILLGVTHLVAAPDLFSGFSQSAVITVMAIFILTNGLYRTGVTRWFGARLLSLSRQRPTRLMGLIMVLAAALSWFMNTIAAGAVLLPAVVGASRISGVRLSKLLIPLSFGALLGGMATLFTTSNILVNAGLRSAGYQPFSLLEFVPVGGIMAVSGIAFIAIVGRRLLPDRAPEDRYAWVGRLDTALSELYSLHERLAEAQLKPDSALCGKTVAESRIGESLGLSILAIVRNRHTRLAPAPDDRLQAGDILAVVGRPERVEQLAEFGFELDRDAAWENALASDAVGLVEILVAPRSRAAGQTLKQINFRHKYGLTVIALWRAGHPHRTDVGDIPLQFGDALLLHGSHRATQVLRSEPDFLVLQPEAIEAQRPRKAVLAASIMIGVVIATAAGWLPIAEAAFIGAVLMILTGCITIDEAYLSIEWRVIFLIAGMLPLGIALQESGAAAHIGQILVQSLGPYGPLVALGGIFLLTVLLTQYLTGQVAAVVVTPIAISAATQIGSNAHAFAMATALACSAAFLTPFAHPINLLIMGPAGYKARDFPRVGWPLIMLCLVLVLVLVPIVWPL